MIEKMMFEHVERFLRSKGYKIKEKHPGHQRGSDIVAERENGAKLFVQMKGDTRALMVDLGTNIYQTMRLMKGAVENTEFAMALTERYRELVTDILYPLSTLRIRVLVVNESGTVEELSRDY